MADLNPELPAVYIISAGPQVQKIGMSQNPFKRLGDLQVASHSNLSLYAYVRTPLALQTEQLVHKKMADHHIRGEWFACSAQEATDAVALWASHVLNWNALQCVFGDLVRPKISGPLLDTDRLYMVEGHDEVQPLLVHIALVPVPISCEHLEVVQDSPAVTPAIAAARSFGRTQRAQKEARLARWRLRET